MRESDAQIWVSAVMLRLRNEVAEQRKNWTLRDSVVTIERKYDAPAIGAIRLIPQDRRPAVLAGCLGGSGAPYPMVCGDPGHPE